MSTDYWLGVATVPALALGLLLFLRAYFAVASRLARAGWFCYLRLREKGPVSDYIIRNNIWWERSFGPVFVGGWYREKPRYEQPPIPFVNRWVGLGFRPGPHLMVGRSRELSGETPSAR